jgi:invasion protein IalB
MKDKTSSPIQPPSFLALGISSLLLLLVLWGMALADQAKPADATPAAQSLPGAAVTPRGQRMAREIKYGEWEKVCFKTPSANAVCRTSINGTFETGQSAVRVDLIEREGEGAARLQLFLPVGLYLPVGVTLTIDKGAAYRVPYVWCLTNTCIAADLANPQLVQDMETGQKLLLEVVDSNVLTVSTAIPLDQFAAAHKNPPAQVYQQDIDE